MKILLKITSFIGLGLTIVPAFLVLFNLMEVESYKNWILLGTLCWLTTAPFWIYKKKEPRQ